MEELRWGTGAAGAEQRGMPGEPCLLLGGSTQRETPAQQAGPADLGDRGQGCHAHQGSRLLAGHQFGPAQRADPGKQLAEDAGAQPVHHQQQHGVLHRKRAQHLVQHLLHWNHALVTRQHLGVRLLKQLREALGQRIPALNHRAAQNTVRRGKLAQLVAPQQPKPRPVDKRALVRLPAEHAGHRGADRGRAHQPACEPPRHLDAVLALGRRAQQGMSQSPVCPAFHLRETCLGGRRSMGDKRFTVCAHALVQAQHRPVAQVRKLADSQFLQQYIRPMKYLVSALSPGGSHQLLRSQRPCAALRMREVRVVDVALHAGRCLAQGNLPFGFRREHHAADQAQGQRIAGAPSFHARQHQVACSARCTTQPAHHVHAGRSGQQVQRCIHLCAQ